MENNRKNHNRKPKRNLNQQRKKEDLENTVVYRTKEIGPKKYADWQLKLMAIRDILDHDVEDFNKAVEMRYQELLHRQG